MLTPLHLQEAVPVPQPHLGNVEPKLASVETENV
jgi:hypothetical protein